MAADDPEARSPVFTARRLTKVYRMGAAEMRAMQDWPEFSYAHVRGADHGTQRAAPKIRTVTDFARERADHRAAKGFDLDQYAAGGGD